MLVVDEVLLVELVLVLTATTVLFMNTSDKSNSSSSLRIGNITKDCANKNIIFMSTITFIYQKRGFYAKTNKSNYTRIIEQSKSTECKKAKKREIQKSKTVKHANAERSVKKKWLGAGGRLYTIRGRIF